MKSCPEECTSTKGRSSRSYGRHRIRGRSASSVIMHDHEAFIVGKIEGHREWGVGRKDSGSSFDGSFAEAVDRCADQLIEECNNIESIAEVDDFFDEEEIE